MNGHTEKSFWTGLYAGLAAGLLLSTLILSILLGMTIARQGHSPAPAGVVPQRAQVPALAAAQAQAQANKNTFSALVPSRGPMSAPIVIQEFADFHCGFCKKASPTMNKILQNYPDKVRLVFRHHPLSVTPGQGSFLTHEAAACAHQQGKFWPFAEAVFAFEKLPSAADLDAIAQKTGLNTAAFKQCVQSGTYREFIKSEVESGKASGISGTPAFIINGQLFSGAQPYESYETIIKDILSGKIPSGGTAPKPAAPATPPPVVKIEDLDGRPSVGPKNAPVTLVIFSDFHCPFCEKLEDSISQVMKNYEGKVRKVWRHYPLPFHAGADRTHQASECAHEQGKFWEYHDAIFAAPAAPSNDQGLADLAGQIKLDRKKFEKCLADGKYVDLVKKEIEKGSQYGVRGTPATFVNGRLVSGAQPYEAFDKAIKDELAKK